MGEFDQNGWVVRDDRLPLGRLVDRRTMRYERTYPVPVERLWQAVSEPAQLQAWYISLPTVLEPALGGRFWFGDENCEEMSGTVIDLEPYRRLVLSFRNGTGAIFALSPHADGTTLIYTHWMNAGFALPQHAADETIRRWNEQPGGPGSYQPALAACWHGSLMALDHHLGGAWPEGRKSRQGGAMFPVKLYRRYRTAFTAQE